MLTKQQKLKIMIREMKSRLPTISHAVEIQVRDIKDQGLFYDELYDANNERYFRIIIRLRQSYSGKVDAIVHEYAHALASEDQIAHGREPSMDHCDLWGKYYARAYRVWLNIDKDFKAKVYG